jgi:hypothetical protein
MITWCSSVQPRLPVGLPLCNVQRPWPSAQILVRHVSLVRCSNPLLPPIYYITHSKPQYKHVEYVATPTQTDTPHLQAHEGCKVHVCHPFKLVVQVDGDEVEQVVL